MGDPVRDEQGAADNDLWKSTGKKKQSSGDPNDNDGCFTAFFWLFIGGAVLIFLLMLFR